MESFYLKKNSKLQKMWLILVKKFITLNMQFPPEIYIFNYKLDIVDLLNNISNVLYIECIG